MFLASALVPVSGRGAPGEPRRALRNPRPKPPGTSGTLARHQPTSPQGIRRVSEGYPKGRRKNEEGRNAAQNCPAGIAPELPGCRTRESRCSDFHYGPVTPRRVRAPGLHPPQNRHRVGWVPSPGVPISSTMRIAGRAAKLVDKLGSWQPFCRRPNSPIPELGPTAHCKPRPHKRKTSKYASICK